MKKKEEEQSAKLIRCGMGLVLGGVAALAVCFVFLLVASAAISGGLAGEELMYQLTIVGCVLGAFAGGLIALLLRWLAPSFTKCFQVEVQHGRETGDPGPAPGAGAGQL